MPAHMNSQSIQQMHQVQQKSQNNLQSAANNRNSSDQSFAAALRSLAKQQDTKDEDMAQQGDSKSSNQRGNEKELEASRQASATRGIQYDNRPTDMRNLTSPQPPEKKVTNNK